MVYRNMSLTDLVKIVGTSLFLRSPPLPYLVPSDGTGKFPVVLTGEWEKGDPSGSSG